MKKMMIDITMRKKWSLPRLISMISVRSSSTLLFPSILCKFPSLCSLLVSTTSFLCLKSESQLLLPFVIDGKKPHLFSLFWIWYLVLLRLFADFRINACLHIIYYIYLLSLYFAMNEHGWTALDWYISEICVQRCMKILQ